MDVSMTLPTMVPHDRDATLAWCREVDAGPWASLAVPERITYTAHDITVELAAAAALTERVRLWSTIGLPSQIRRNRKVAPWSTPESPMLRRQVGASATCTIRDDVQRCRARS